MPTTLTLTNPSALPTAIQVLRAGGLVICPTETVYGLLADPTNPAAVDKLLRYKRRPSGKAISIAVNSQAMAGLYVTLNDQAQQLYHTLLPGPVTVVSASRHQVDTRLESEFGTLGIRWPDHPFLLDLITSFDHPVTATSANAAGKKTPYSIPDILQHLTPRQTDLLDLVLDAGTLPHRPPSLVIDTTPSTPIVIRSHQQLTQFDRSTATYTTHSPTDTQALAGKILLPHLDTLHRTGLIVALDGALGAGKTTLTQGIAAFLGITGPVTSPTYTYLKEYPYQKFDRSGTLYHLDAWSLDQPAAINALQLDTLQSPDHLLVIEWYNNLIDFFTPHVPLLHLQLTPDPQITNSRQLIVTDFSQL